MPEYQKPDPNTDAAFAKLLPVTDPQPEPRTSPSDAMPWFLCHKMVRAAKILETSIKQGPGFSTLKLDGISDLFPVTNPWAAKHDPRPGGYLVQYADGYLSYSPAEAFEAGYTRCGHDGDPIYKTPEEELLVEGFKLCQKTTVSSLLELLEKLGIPNPLPTDLKSAIALEQAKQGWIKVPSLISKTPDWIANRPCPDCAYPNNGYADSKTFIFKHDFEPVEAESPRALLAELMDGREGMTEIGGAIFGDEEAKGDEAETPLTLAQDITHAINRHSAENGSNTPDFILAEYLINCLAAFNKASTHREEWYGKALRIGGVITYPPIPKEFPTDYLGNPCIRITEDTTTPSPTLPDLKRASKGTAE